MSSFFHILMCLRRCLVCLINGLNCLCTGRKRRGGVDGARGFLSFSGDCTSLNKTRMSALILWEGEVWGNIAFVQTGWNIGLQQSLDNLLSSLFFEIHLILVCCFFLFLKKCKYRGIYAQFFWAATFTHWTPISTYIVYRGSNPALSFAGASCVEV